MKYFIITILSILLIVTSIELYFIKQKNIELEETINLTNKLVEQLKIYDNLNEQLAEAYRQRLIQVQNQLK